MTRVPNDSRYLFGLHDPGGEGIMLNAGRQGWVLFTEELGSDPSNRSGADYTPWSSRGLGIISRLNNGYEPNGTIPHSSQYQNFAARCANFVRASRGCHIWIIGNEMNYSVEWPRTVRGMGIAAPREQAPPPAGGQDLWASLRRGVQSILARLGLGGSPAPQPAPSPTPGDAPQADDPRGRGRPERFSALHPELDENQDLISRSWMGEVITPELYVRCYTLCRNAIRSVPGHEQDQVLVGAVAPWNNQTKYPANPLGDWIKYFEDILTMLGPDGCDGFTLHTYTHQADPNLITSPAKMNPPFQNRHYEFRTYQDFMNAVPRDMRHLPAYITETDQDVPWYNANIGWVQRAYGEIDFWNRQPGNQQIRSMILYRWPRIDRWYIEGKAGVIEDFREAMKFEYRWQVPVLPQLTLKVGDFVRSTTTLNTRRTPGYIGKPSGDVVTEVDPTQLLQVISEQYRIVDNLVWWQVRLYQGPMNGEQVWVAETSPASGGLLLQMAEAPLDPPEVEPTPPITSGFATGDTVRTLTIVNLRRSPGYRNKPVSDVVAQLPADSVMEINDGPQTADDLRWWRVDLTLNNQRMNGWLADAATNGTPLLEKIETAAPTPQPEPQPEPEPEPEPQPQPDPTPPPTQGLAPGLNVVTLTVVRMRRTPGHVNKPPQDVIGDVGQGAQGQIISGPQQVDGLTWWQVRVPFNGAPTQGWMAEVAPNGVTLLARADQVPPPAAAFSRSEIISATEVVRVRRSTGFMNKPENDVLGQFWSRTTLRVEDGPQEMDGLTWWLVTGVSSTGQTITGWTAQQAPNGNRLIAKPLKLGNTDIPNPGAGRYLAAPYQGSFFITQLWGENPAIYRQFLYDGVPLLGHNGVDFATPVGVPLLSTDDGQVIQAAFDHGGFGNFVLIRHSWGESVYAHLSRVSVRVNQTLRRGQHIGDSGNTGNSTGPHLHFAIRMANYTRGDGWGGYSDPLPYLPPNSYQLPGYFRSRDAVSGFSAEDALAQGQALGRLNPEEPGRPRP